MVRVAAKSTLITVALSAALGGCGSSGATVGTGIVFSPHHHNAHNAVVRVVTARRWVAVTFDDGPDRHWTPRFLRLLARHHAHGTFFFIGQRALAAPSAVAATLRSGNEVGNHTLDHPVLTRLRSAEIGAEIRRGGIALEQTGAGRPRLFRPPFGAFDERVGLTAARAGETMIGWDLPLDRALDGRSPLAAARSVAARVRPGSIVLAHDGSGDRRRNLAAVSHLLDELSRRGYRVVTVGRLLR